VGDWTREFNEPVPLPEGGRPLRTLRDAAAYIEALPAAEQQHADVKTALHVLLQAADSYGPMMFARSA